MGEHEGSSMAFSLGKAARIGKIEVGGHVAGRDVVVGTTPAELAATQDIKELLALLERLQEQAGNLPDTPVGAREDAQDELRKAREAGEQGQTDRLIEKLGAAQAYLARIGESVPAALALAQTVATLVQRVSGLV